MPSPRVMPVTPRAAGPRPAATAARPGRVLPALAEPRADALMWALALTLLMYIWRLQNLLPILGAIKAMHLSMLLALGAFVSNRHPLRLVALVKNQKIVRYWLAILAIMVLGVPFAIVRSPAAMSIAQVVIPNLLILVLVASSVRSTRDIEWYAMVSLVGAVVFAGAKAIGLDTLGYYDRNDLALMLVAHIPFAVYFLRPGVGGVKRLFALGALPLIIFVVIKGGSRGGFIGLLAIATYILLRYRGIPVRTRLLAVVGGAALLSLVATDQFWARMRTLLNPKADYNWSGNSDTGRMDVWKRGMGYMFTHPLFGVGLANFSAAEGRSSEAIEKLSYGAGFKWSVAHNSFVEIGAELGVIALGLFIAIVYSAMRDMARIRQNDALAAVPSGAGPPRDLPLSQMLLGSLIGYVLCGFFLSAEHFSMLYLLLGLVVGLVKLRQIRMRMASPGAPAVRPQTAPRGAARVPATGRAPARAWPPRPAR